METGGASVDKEIYGATDSDLTAILRKVKGTQYFEESAPIAGCAYDAANLLLQAIKKAGSDKVEKVKAALEGLSFSGVSGGFTFDVHHNPIKAVDILRISGGKIAYDSAVLP